MKTLQLHPAPGTPVSAPLLRFSFEHPVTAARRPKSA